jgi:type II secretory pathway component PulF
VAAKRQRRRSCGQRVPKNLAVFTRQFSVMIDAGLPLVQCLDILGNQEDHKYFQQVILQTRTDVEGGQSLAEAMRRHPKVFDALYTNMIAAGEAGGILDMILKRLAVYIEKAVKLKSQVQSAMIYPAAVVVIAAVVVGVILWKVIPTFALFAGLGAERPCPPASSFPQQQPRRLALLIVGGWWALRAPVLRHREGTARSTACCSSAHPGNILRKASALLPYSLHAHGVGRAHSRRPRHHGEDRRQRHHRGCHPGDPQGIER